MAAGRASTTHGPRRADRDAVRRRQRLPRDARQPRGGPPAAQPRHVPQRLPRDVADRVPAEDAYGFATTGQTIVNVPDAKIMKLYVDDEPLELAERRRGTTTSASSTCATARSPASSVWRTAGGQAASVRSQRLVSLRAPAPRGDAFEVTMLDGAAPVVISSEMLNRQDGEDEDHVARSRPGNGRRPRKMRQFTTVLSPEHHGERPRDRPRLPPRQQRMTLACAYHATCRDAGRCTSRRRSATTSPRRRRRASRPADQTCAPSSSYHDAARGRRGARRPPRPHPRPAEQDGRGAGRGPAGAGSTSSGSATSSRGDDAAQQAMRWNLFQLAQASAQTEEHGSPPRASPAAATRATTSGTRRPTSSRS